MKAMILLHDGRTVVFQADGYAENGGMITFYRNDTDGEMTETGRFRMDQVSGFCLK